MYFDKVNNLNGYNLKTSLVADSDFKSKAKTLDERYHSGSCETCTLLHHVNANISLKFFPNMHISLEDIGRAKRILIYSPR